MEERFRTYHVSLEKGIFGVAYHILTAPEERNGSRLYTIETHKIQKPHMKIIRHVQPATYATGDAQFPQNPGTPFFPPPYNLCGPAPLTGFGAADQVVATVNFHGLSSKIDVTLCNKSGPSTSFVMKRPDPFGASHRRFYTPTLGQLTWKREDLLRSNHHLLDQNKRVVARYEKHASILSGRKRYEFFIPGSQEFAGTNLDVVFTTAFAGIEYNRRSDKEWTEWTEWI